ncbi:MAG TPA: hypothetical protein VFT53_03230 [Candidatus Saccharimonadales bacterium]|nr:hypothetical protein [Candidatus Saccharimonadales bacterium]
MKKPAVGVIALIVVAGAATALFLVFSHNKTKPNESSNTSYAAVDACSIMTNNVANQILGNSAIRATTPADAESTSDIAFSNCAYSAGPNIDPPHMASLAVRSAKDSAGAASNKSVFTIAGRPAGVQTLTGYGDAAYWDPGMGQLDILKGNNWYIVTNYTGTSPANGIATLAMAEQLTQAITLQ